MTMIKIKFKNQSVEFEIECEREDISIVFENLSLASLVGERRSDKKDDNRSSEKSPQIEEKTNSVLYKQNEQIQEEIIKPQEEVVDLSSLTRT